jgi:hypothetical protein
MIASRVLSESTETDGDLTIHNKRLDDNPISLIPRPTDGIVRMQVQTERGANWIKLAVFTNEG